jgi:hypothetical protein
MILSMGSVLALMRLHAGPSSIKPACLFFWQQATIAPKFRRAFSCGTEEKRPRTAQYVIHLRHALSQAGETRRISAKGVRDYSPDAKRRRGKTANFS